MVNDVNGLIGRRDAIIVIRELADRPVVAGRRRSQLRPVLVVEGAAGTGKTALLAVVASMLDQRVPSARIDFEAARAATTPEMLSVIAFQLSRHCPGYGSISFPRFAIGQLVINERLDLTHRGRACRQVMSLLARERGIDSLEQIFLDTAGTAIDAVVGQLGLPTEVRPSVGTGTKGLFKVAVASAVQWRRARRIVLGKYHNWFGHRDRGLSHDAIDVLVELSSWAEDPDSGDHRQAIDDLLWDSFLTDLRAHFRSERRAGGLAMNCVLLMDNADTRMAQEFIAGLILCRGTRREDPDPLTAVATSRGDLLADRDAADIAERGAAGPVGAWVRWRRHRLVDLTMEDTLDLVVRAGLRSGNTPRLPRLVHDLTEGHPAATRLMVSAAVRHEDARDDPRALLDRLEPGAGPDRLRVSDRMRTSLLVDFPDATFDDLVTCSSAADEQHARSLIDLLDGGENSLRLVTGVLWPPVEGAGPRVLRRLLLPLLALRDEDHPASWLTVFDRHRQAHTSSGDIAEELYYALACEDLAHVVARLNDQFDVLSTGPWRDLLLAVVAAPRRPPCEVESPNDQMLALLRGEPGLAPVELARLVAASWIVKDPFTDGRRRGLHLQIAADYQALAGACAHDDVQPLRQAGRRHLRYAELWSWN